MNFLPDASHTNVFNQTIIAIRNARNETKMAQTGVNTNSPMGKSGQTHRNNESYKDKDSSAGMPELVERPDDSDDDDTVENSVNGTESTLDVKYITTLD